MSLWKALTAAYNSTPDFAKVRIDAATSSLQTVDYAHHEIHSGSSFSIYVHNTTAATDDHRTLIGFETPDTTKWVHLTIYASCTAAAEVFLYEGVTIDDDEGTELTVLNRNRNSATTSTVLSFENPAVANTVTWMLEAEVAAANFATTTTLYHTNLIASSGPKALGGETRATEEWVLDQATKYAIVVQNTVATANIHEIHLEWYEHTDHN